MICNECGSNLSYTTYIRSVRRSEKTHHTRQAWIPAGRLCLDCKYHQTTLDAEEVRITRRRRGTP